MDGVLIVDKPEGMTSFDVVRKVRALGSGRKAGHTGTLDPSATGVLPICLGQATKLSSFLLEGDKEYQGVVQLGVETDTFDAEGKVVATQGAGHLTEEEVRRAVEAMAGSYWQTPPMYSAVKVGGKRLYELARQGMEVERKPRKVTIHSIEMLSYDAEKARLELRLACSKGTYVRSVAHEIGQALGVGGHLVSLKRLRNGPFGLDRAIPLETIEAWMREGKNEEIEARLVSLSDALAEMKEVRVDELRARKVARGMALGYRDLLQSAAPRLVEGDQVKITGPKGRLLAVAEQREGALRYRRVLVGGGE